MGEKRRLTIPARLDSVPIAREFVTEAARAAGLGSRAVYHCQMAVDEACTNIIEHGYGGREGTIDLECHILDDRLVISITDDSPRFNPLEIEEPNPDASLDDRSGGGWGIYFMKKMMDEIHWSYRGGRNRLTMIKRLKSRPDEHLRDEALVSASEIKPGVWVIGLSGRLDSVTAPRLERTLGDEVSAGHVRMIVDMSGVEYISSSGLKALVKTWRAARKQGGDVLLASLRPEVAEVFELIGFTQVFGIYPSVDEALAGAGW